MRAPNRLTRMALSWHGDRRPGTGHRIRRRGRRAPRSPGHGVPMTHTRRARARSPAAVGTRQDPGYGWGLRRRSMDREQLRAVQAPLKERYRDDPAAALVTLRAEGTLDPADG